jgi:hypothetical protein
MKAKDTVALPSRFLCGIFAQGSGKLDPSSSFFSSFPNQIANCNLQLAQLATYCIALQ